MTGRITALVLTLVAAPALAGPLEAQEWKAEAQAGRFHYLGGRVNTAASSLSLGIRRDGVRNGLLFSAGLPLSGTDPLWGYASLWQRAVVDRGGFFAGVDLSGHGFLHRNRQPSDATSSPWPPGLRGLLGDAPDPIGEGGGTTAYGLGGEVLPLVGYASARARVEARSGVSHVRTGFSDGESFGRTLRLSDARVTVAPTDFLLLQAQVQRFGADEGTYNYGGVTARLAHSHGSVWASTGRWFSVEDSQTPWGVGASFDIDKRTTISVAGRREGFDPVYLTGPRSSWSIGVGYRFGTPKRPAEPVPAVYEEGRATILLPTADADEQPLVAGDFNGWNPEPMTKNGKNWSYTVAVAPGAYNYAFVSVDGTWFVPESVPGRKDDGMGGHVAVLIVR